MSADRSDLEYFKKFKTIERFSARGLSMVHLVEFDGYTAGCPYPRKAVLKKLNTSDEYDLTQSLFQSSGFFVRPLAMFSLNSLEDYMVLEYCSNGDLNKRLQSPTITQSTQYILFQFRNLAMAISKMHSMSIAHRDIKPGNIFITGRNTLKLGDFDISKRIDQVGSINTFKGTLRFMPRYLKHMDMNCEPAEGPKHAMNIDRYGFSCCLWLSLCPIYYHQDKWKDFFNQTDEKRMNIIIDTLKVPEELAYFFSATMLNEDENFIEFKFICQFLESWLNESIREPNQFICYLCDASVINCDHIALSFQCQGHLIHVECYAEFLKLWPDRYTCPLCNAELNPNIIEVFKSRYCN